MFWRGPNKKKSEWNVMTLILHIRKQDVSFVSIICDHTNFTAEFGLFCFPNHIVRFFSVHLRTQKSWFKPKRSYFLAVKLKLHNWSILRPIIVSLTQSTHFIFSVKMHYSILRTSCCDIVNQRQRAYLKILNSKEKKEKNIYICRQYMKIQNMCKVILICGITSLSFKA